MIKLINQTASSGLCPTFFNPEKNVSPPSKEFKIRFQELSFLRFRVVDSDRNDLLATNTIPLRAARWGLVSVPLLRGGRETRVTHPGMDEAWKLKPEQACAGVARNQHSIDLRKLPGGSCLHPRPESPAHLA